MFLVSPAGHAELSSLSSETEISLVTALSPFGAQCVELCHEMYARQYRQATSTRNAIITQNSLFRDLLLRHLPEIIQDLLKNYHIETTIQISLRWGSMLLLPPR